MNLRTEFENMTRNNLLRNYEIDLEFSKLSRPKRSNLEISQSDLHSNIIRLNLLMNNNPIVLDESYVIYANVKKPTGEVNPNYCEIYDGVNGSILLRIQPQYIDVDGSCSFEIIVVTGDGVKVVSPEVNFIVTQSLDYFLGEPDLEDVSNLDFLVKTVAGLKESVLTTNSNIEQNEEIRNNNEELREQSENLREEQENLRQSKFEQIEADFEEIKSISDEKIANLDNISDKYTAEINSIKAQHQERVDKFDNEIITFYESSKVNENIRESNENQRKADEEARKSAENKRDSQESQRQSNENNRREFFETVVASENTRDTNEQNRKTQEQNRVNSFSSMQRAFDDKVDTIDSKLSQITTKITEATNKINQFSNNEDVRKREHNERINEFDTVIRASHSEMVASEQNRKTQELNRQSAENERTTFFNQVKKDESLRVTADEKREEKVRTLEARVDSKINETSNHVRTLEARVNEKIDETDAHVTTLEDRVNAKINEYNTATLITNAEIDTIIANALK